MRVLIFECQVSFSKSFHVSAADFNGKIHTDLMKDEMLFLECWHLHHDFCYFNHVAYGLSNNVVSLVKCGSRFS